MDCNLFSSWLHYCCSQAHSYHVRNSAYMSNFDNPSFFWAFPSHLHWCKDLQCLRGIQRGTSEMNLPAQHPRLKLTEPTLVSLRVGCRWGWWLEERSLEGGQGGWHEHLIGKVAPSSGNPLGGSGWTLGRTSQEEMWCSGTAAQGGGGVTMPGGAQELLWLIGTWFSGQYWG